MKNLFSFLFVALSFSSTLFSQHTPEITAKDLKADVYFLASDSLKGRKPGTKEADMAAGYIRDQFKAAGLKLICEDGFQYFEIVTDVTLGDGNALSFEGFQGNLKKDFMPVAYSSNGSVSNPVVFAGYGFDIDQDSLKWKDYEGLDVKGKWVMLFRGDPELDKNDSKFIPFTEIRGKVLVAKDHGAAGVLVVTPVGVDKDDKLIGLHTENNDVTSGIPVINIKREVANMLLKSSGFKVDSLEKILNNSRKPNSLQLQVIVTGSANLVLKKARTENVVGMLEGNDPLLKDEYIVVGAHYDHLGFGGQGSGSRMPDTLAVHNGADDNASGTAMVMELAGKFGPLKNRLKRSIIFISFTGEEMGLLGSKYFTDHCPVDMKKIKAMFNFDMVGRFDKEKNSISISGTGTSLEGDSIIRIFEKNVGFTVTHSPDGYGPSDHAAFYASNIPVFYFTTGAHTDYHTPFDDAEKLDYEKEKEIGDLGYNLIMNIDNLNQALTFRESGKKESSGRGGRRMKVTLGIMPDFAGTEKKGLRVDGVTKEGPADKGGMLKGDIIISINGMSVGNIYDYMARLGKLKQGQTISVEVIRNGKNIVLIIPL
ncbi:MAG: M28 family peptidase [Bacteroidetes bacterium]|nr:M28 family peptidase [Bacteroidota bacterium]